MTSGNEDNFTIALIGAGNMGGAMLGGWLSDGIAANRIMVMDPAPPPSMTTMMEANGIICHGSAPANQAVDVVIIAVKPQIMGAVLPGITGLIGAGTVIVSVAAGITISSICGKLGDIACVRAMPNTPALIQRGITVGYANQKVAELQRSRVDCLLNATGSFAWVDSEQLIDAVTAVSGSGPAYVFHLAECMAAAGVKAGLPDNLALRLAVETIAGAGELMMRSDEGPDHLRANVTSPNGTTAAALAVLMADNGMQKLMERAIFAAWKRSEELSE